MMNDDFLHYNALDAACTLEAHNGFWIDLGDYQRTYDLTAALLPPLMFMMTKGIRVDHDAISISRAEVRERIDSAQVELDSMCGRHLNVNSPKDCQKYFYIEKGIPPYYNNGTPTVDDLSLQRLSRPTAKREGLREAKLVQEIRGAQKLLSTYLEMEFDDDGRMRCSYNPRGSRFGRLSSSKTIYGTGMNMQNLPPEMKRFLVADPGHVLWEIDKRQAEWVVVAYLAGDDNMISVIENGEDTHTHTASMMFNVPKELVLRENKLVGHMRDVETLREVRMSDPELALFIDRMPRNMSIRQCGKKSNHGLNYDEGPNNFALINEMEQSEGRRIVELYHMIYPGIRQWYGRVQRQLQKDRTLTNCFGRKVRFMDAWGPDLWKAAYSMLPQSTVVDSLNMGMVEIYHDRRLPIDLLAQVHDSLLFQVPISVVKTPAFWNIVERCYRAISPTMEYNQRKFTIATDSKIGLNWAGAHHERNPFGMRDFDDAESLSTALGELECLSGS